VNTILADLTAAHGGSSDAYVVVDTEDKEFCISALFHESTGGHYCVDHNGVFKTTVAACPIVAPIECP
jgi:hypothetical protein